MPGKAGQITSLVAPATAGITSTADSKVAPAPVWLECLTKTLPPCKTSRATDCVNLSLTNCSFIGSIVKSATSSGGSFLPVASSSAVAGVVDSCKVALYEKTLN